MKLLRSASNPILSANPNNEWENLVVLNPAVIYDEESQEFVMLYRAAGDTIEHFIYLGLATSNDGVHFERKSNQPIFEPIYDGEDGVITPTIAMINYNGLDLTNPVMGSYNIEVVATDSQGLASSTYTFHVNVVTVLENFNSFTDDADFKANFTSLYGFRTAGGSWAASVGSMVTDVDNNVLQVAYGTGTNGIRLCVSRATLEGMGAEYVGIYVKTSAEITGASVFQAFYYNAAGYTSLATYGNITYTDGGTYVYVKVSDLAEDTVSISLLINLVAGNTGTMSIDNLVIK